MANNYSDRELKGIMNDVLDESRVVLVCQAHRYIAGEAPPESTGCRACWQAWWTHKIATTPPHLRQQRLEEAYRAVFDAVKSYERGEFDFQPFDHAITEILKDAEPD